jgi:hypothetical protein
MSIADMARATRSDAMFYVMDTDRAYEAMIEGYPKLAEWPNIIVEEPFLYTEMMEVAEEFQGKAKRGDWIVCDMVSAEWEAVQTHYSREVFGVTKAEYFLQRRQEMEDINREIRERRKAGKKADKEKKVLQPFEGYTDWNVIKPMHAEFVNTVILNNRAHVFVTAGSKALSRSGDTKRIVEQFEHVGARPEGEKRMAHLLHTCMLLKRADEDEWEMSTGKDREREQLWRAPLDSSHQFVKEYLMKVAGWKLN